MVNVAQFLAVFERQGRETAREAPGTTGRAAPCLLGVFALIAVFRLISSLATQWWNHGLVRISSKHSGSVNRLPSTIHWSLCRRAQMFQESGPK